MESQKPADRTDEIDLGQLFTKMGDFFASIWFGFMRFFALIRRVPIENKATFLLLIAGAIVVGSLYANFLKKKFYETSMILSSDYLNKRIVDNAIEKLNLLAREVDTRGLARVLRIPDSLAKNILEFTAKPFVKETDLIELEVLKEQLKNAQLESKNKDVIDQVIRRIEIENRHAFEITVRVYNPTIIRDLENALILFFRDNDYVKKRIDITKSNLLAKKQKLLKDRQKLDSLKEIIYSNYKSMAMQSRQGSNNVILSDKAVTDPVQIYQQDIIAYNELESVNRDLYLQPDFEVITRFTQFSEPSSASPVKVTALAILVAIVLGYLIIAISTFNEYLSRIG
ncbi:MAG TPA: hypothetical protein VK517_14955 [Cyclobacteriaceae bacterium]|nr:hypothetical protein [Cyclobacteriaceae bacterium]